MSVSLGAEVVDGGTRFAVRSATPVTLCLFDDAGERQLPMTGANGVWHAEVQGAGVGTRYGYRAAADPAKLLADPYAIQLDRPFHYDPCLGEPSIDTAVLVPRAIVTPPPSAPLAPPLFTPRRPDLRTHVRGFTMLHPDVPEAQRGTIAALAHPAIIAHLTKLKVAAIELMPIVAWIDERHLPPLGLTNSWGYNPVVPMAIDPRLAPGGVAELVETVAALRSAGIGVILDLVLNHTGESDSLGPTLSLRGFDEALYYAHAPDGRLVNDTGTGNTLDCSRPEVRALILDSLRHFARCGVDGFRFDLATILARGPGFDPHAPIFAEIAADPLLASRVMIAEPWDIGPGGYQLGRFPDHWLEWNDRYRDDVRRFWRGDGSTGELATRIAGSADLFGPDDTRTVNFLAAHDGFTLADLVSYAERHNHANGEDNRDGHGDNLSWNNGVEGPSDDPVIRQRRRDDLRALLATLFASRGTIMLTAGDEFGRTQQGNNNAYAQDNAIGWVDWQNRDRDLEDFVAALAAYRAANRLDVVAPYADADWRALDGEVMTPGRWHDAPGFELRLGDGDAQIALRIDRQTRRVSLSRRTIVESR
ncbi:glycogen debranching protein [Sphingomonas melonis]|uniref:Glycogen debranching protein n=1 Tax=Sphingomonas melonis TaxID=152682 RepID=A0A0D1MQX8_9SPHN|nr:glycogen debranching protein GlgX [Sphingomonas melonis]KIU29756.1 glycogen debranching protein [Sphingomonas melonis]